MTDMFRVMTWNLQGEVGIDESRLQRQLDVLDTHAGDVDCLLFQAVNAEEGSPGDWGGHLGTLIDHLEARGYHVVHTGEWAQELAASTVQPHADITAPHNRCNLTASRWPIERRPLPLRNRGDGKPHGLNYYYVHFPEKLLLGTVDCSGDPDVPVDELQVWNVGIINGAGWGEEKVKMLETVYARIYLETTTTDTPVLLGGDFNAPKHENADGTITPHGANKGQYTRYPFYGDPHYLRGDDDQIDEYRFDRRWQLAERRIFDPEVGEWGMSDAYWAAKESQRASSEDDFTHIVHNATPPAKRLDHLLVSETLEARECELWNGTGGSVDGLDASDHAPVVASLRFT